MTRNFLSLLSLFCVFTAVAHAETSPNELIIRYKHPVAAQTAREHILSVTNNAQAKTQIVNSAEGVVHLSFTTAAEAEAARKQLASSSEVLSAAPNFLYRPALSLRWKEVHEAVDASDYYLLPFSGGGHHHPGQPTPGNNPPDGMIPTPGLPDMMIPTAATPGVDPLAGNDWALTSIHQPSIDALSSITTSAQQIIAAVIDTGVDYNHEDLVGAMWRNPADQSVGYDFVHHSSKPYDQLHFDLDGCLKDASCKLGIDSEKFLSNPGHGTHCAGHVGAVAGNSLGIRGVGAGVQVMALKFFYDFGEANAGSGDDAASIQAIDFAIKNGVKVISASWGGREKKADGEKSELKNALLRAQAAGVLVVIASGNDGIDQEAVADPDYPAAYTLDNLLVVAAVDSADNLASFSNWGATTVHIAAPGVKVLSTTVGSKYNDVVASFTDEAGKTHEMDWDGTSMATPIVAGAAALLWAQNPTWNYHQIRDRILSTARPVPGLAGKVSSGGVLNVSSMLGLN